MTEKVTILRQDGLPMPLIYLHTAEDLAAWYVGQMAWSVEQGERELAVSCFDTVGMGYDVGEAACVVLKALAEFLHDYPEVVSLHILCGDEAAYRAYSIHWDMWYASRNPKCEY